MKMRYIFLKCARRLLRPIFADQYSPRLPSISDPQLASDKIKSLLDATSPVMIARFGGNELACVVNCLEVARGKRSVVKYLLGVRHQWWRDNVIASQMQSNAGFFPNEPEALDRFSVMMKEQISSLDLLGSWLPLEGYFRDQLICTERVDLELLNPFFAKNPWSLALKGKRVLVIHPFAVTIQSQYRKRMQIFPDGLLPEFELITIKAVQSIGGRVGGYSDWFAALEEMKRQMESISFDVALIGCGAYGFPLAAYAKQLGKKGFHIGGSLQLLFGVRGKRWEDPRYHAELPYYKLINDAWVRPNETERPLGADKVEGGCYW